MSSYYAYCVEWLSDGEWVPAAIVFSAPGEAVRDMMTHDTEGKRIQRIKTVPEFLEIAKQTDIHAFHPDYEDQHIEFESGCVEINIK